MRTDSPARSAPATRGEASPSAARSGIGWLARQLTTTPEVLPATLLVLVVAVFWGLNPAFLSTENVSGLLAFLPEIGLIALGMTMLLTAGQFDLSVGAVFGFAPLLTFMLVNQKGLALPWALIIGLTVAGLIGLVNGLVVTKFGLSSFLVTLSTQLVIAGSALYLSSGFPQSTLNTKSSLIPWLAGTTIVGGVAVRTGLLWFLLVAAVLWYFLNQTRLGNWVIATGGNREAARGRGINTDRVTIWLFVLASVLAAFAGVISDVRIGSAHPTSGVGYELQAIAIAVVGGTSLFGGSGTIAGTVIGTFLLWTINNGVVLIGVPGLAVQLFIGLVILMAIILQTGLRKLRLKPGGQG